MVPLLLAKLRAARTDERHGQPSEAETYFESLS